MWKQGLRKYSSLPINEGEVTVQYRVMTELVSFKLNRTLLVKIDGISANRSDFIREAVEEKLRRTNRRGLSIWDALRKTEGLDIRVAKTAGNVKGVIL